MDAMLGQYRVTGTLGRGGMGVVHAAEHTLLGRRAAIKVLRTELSRDEEAVTRFFNEARAAAAIRHPGIVEVYDFGWTPDGAAYIVMEYLEGESLTRRSERALFRWPAALAIARQIAGALAAAHAMGIVHRDLKPDNVLIVPDPDVPGGERIKLLDFGIAKLAVASSTLHSVTRTGAVIGTPTYMSPEQCRGVAVDHRADLYALGCVLYGLCCGRPPFVGEGAGDVLAAHIHLPVPAMSDTNAEIPQMVEALVRRLLAKAPVDRLQTADKVILAIDAMTFEPTPGTSASPAAPAATGQVVTGSAMTTLSGSVVMTAQQQGTAQQQWTTRLRWSVAGFAAFLVVITIAIVTVGTRQDDRAVAAVPAAAAPAQTAALVVAAGPDGARNALGPPVAQTPVPPAAQTPRDEAPAPPVEPAAPPALIDVVVESAPSGAEVLLGGVVRGSTPFVGRLPRGDRDVKLVIRLAGYVDRTIRVHPTAPLRESVTLARKPPPAVPKPSTPDRDRSVNPFD